ncbi:hypothetical protein [Archangium lansingense]|uniref:Uncharacterized protein n=1 Tax=Archangium lansingense TaxID=2995310 RepID=A0ABT3ZV98_9BACT|nr:hypothetical protein [Archangium lansinium]MCY1073332.1 hypothetical protein [Archangium lansinium]
MNHGPPRLSESWSLRDGASTVHIRRRQDVPVQEAARGLAPSLVRWKLEHWMHSSPGALRSLYESLGGRWPWELTSLERQAHAQRVVNRLVEAFESGELVAVVEQMPRFAGHLPERTKTSPRDEPPARPRPVPESPKPAPAAAGPAMDAAAQARILREAARQGVPFCEECEKRRASRQQTRAAA